MLEMRSQCEGCGQALGHASDAARICSYECTFCAACAGAMGHRCPNCGGELVRRPMRIERPSAGPTCARPSGDG
ncbi:MAG: DUF1272 domain-containing protein [Gemmatimonadales bacterium]|nr:DUF1272 domain-containing protein [Gemmatimonadales bacterium]